MQMSWVRQLEMERWEAEKWRDLKKKARSGVALNEIGMALDFVRHWEEAAEEIAPGRRAIQLYREWRQNAVRGVHCWMCLSRKLGLVKDMRILIANLVWEQRSAWVAPVAIPSERPSSYDDFQWSNSDVSDSPR